MADEAVAKYNVMALDFQKQSENLLHEILSGFAHAMDATKKNYTTLVDGYVKGYNDISEQAKKANADMISNLQNNFNDLKASVDNLHKQLQSNTTTAFDQSIAQFVKQAEDTVQKFPADLSDAPHKATVKYLKERQTKLFADFAKKHKDTVDQLEQKFKKLVHDLKIPDIPPPNIVNPTYSV